MSFLTDNEVSKKIFGQHNDAKEKIEKLKQEILCDGDMCKPVNIVTSTVYDRYIERLKENFPNAEDRVRKQRQFNSLCNLLFDTRNAFMVYQSNAKNNVDSSFHYKDKAFYMDVAKMPKNVFEEQQNAFFMIRDATNDLPANTDIKLVVTAKDMNAFDIVRFYLNMRGKTHIIGYLLLESFEMNINKIEFATGSFLQKAVAQLLMGALVQETRDMIEFV